MKDYLFNASLSTNAQRFSGLDLVRFVAALMVMLYHFTATGIGNTLHPDRHNLIATSDLLPWLTPVTKFGFLGVNLFFLISGFIIFASAANRTAIDFAVYRWIRLFPTYWTSIVFTVLVLFFFLGASLNLPLKDVIINLTMIQSYFDVKDLDPVYWTLLVELHFYFLIFLLLLFNQLKAWRFWVSLWMVVAWVFYFTDQPFFYAYMINTQYAGYFIGGMVIYSLVKWKIDSWSLIMIVLAYLLCCVHLPQQIQLYNFGKTDIVHNIVGYFIVALFFAILYVIALGKLKFRATSTLITMGALTYPLYLTHHQLGRYMLDALAPNVNPYVNIALAITVSFVIAWCIVQLIDLKLTPAIKRVYVSKFRNKGTNRL